MVELSVAELASSHVGRRVIVHCPTGRGTWPEEGVLTDVVHTAGRASWLTLRLQTHLAVLIVDDPAATSTSLGEAADPAADPAPESVRASRSGRWAVSALLQRLLHRSD